MGRTATDYNSSDMFQAGTTMALFRDNFKFGRKTVYECSWNIGFMPSPTDGCNGLQNVFIDHIYNGQSDPWKLTAAISGAHTLGSARISTSGFDGFWSDAANQSKFNNDYYKSIILKGWGPELAVNGVSGKNQWQRLDRGITGHKEMMLDTDMCLVYNNNKDLADCKAANESSQCGQF